MLIGKNIREPKVGTVHSYENMIVCTKFHGSLSHSLDWHGHFQSHRFNLLLNDGSAERKLSQWASVQDEHGSWPGTPEWHAVVTPVLLRLLNEKIFLFLSQKKWVRSFRQFSQNWVPLQAGCRQHEYIILQHLMGMWSVQCYMNK